ncbi:MAG: Grx4 family monothiol glutaredoxin [bacterium]|nr:Grx4 family monothiol glutaredoxin [bacterium]
MQGHTIEEWTEQIKKSIESNHVFIFAKGEKNAAMCGFSHRVMEIFNALGVPFEVQNIFADANVRPAVCAYTNWPTTPQVFVGGKFIGGCDIVTEMYQTGELQKLLEQNSSAQS